MSSVAETLEEHLYRLLEGYGKHYEIRREVQVGSEKVPAMAEYHLLEDRYMFGVHSDKLKAKGKEANEYVLFCLEETFDADCAQRVIELSKAVEEERLHLHEDHGSSFFSVVVLAGTVLKEGAAKLKRYRRLVNYDHGWGMGRISVLDTGAGTYAHSRDGKELSRVVKLRMEGKELS